MSSGPGDAPITVLAIVTVNEDDPEGVARFQRAARAVLDAVGARLVRRFRLSATAADVRERWVGVVEYPDDHAVRAVFETGAFERLQPLRTRAFSSVRIEMAANVDPALASQLP